MSKNNRAGALLLPEMPKVIAKNILFKIMEEIKNEVPQKDYYNARGRKMKDFGLGFFASIIFVCVAYNGFFLDIFFPTVNRAYGPGPVRDVLIIVLPLTILYLAIRIPMVKKRKFFVWGFLSLFAIGVISWFIMLLTFTVFHPLG